MGGTNEHLERLESRSRNRSVGSCTGVHPFAPPSKAAHAFASRPLSSYSLLNVRMLNIHKCRRGPIRTARRY
eukprot:8894711-Alexandrium_andersonii.AAC.1